MQAATRSATTDKAAMRIQSVDLVRGVVMVIMAIDQAYRNASFPWPRYCVQSPNMGAMYIVDELDRAVELEGFPLLDPGAPCPNVFAEEHQLVLSYCVRDEPPYPPTTAPLAIVRFSRPYFHMFGPPNVETFDGHPLANQGLHPYGVFRVEKSSLIRSLERMNSVHEHHNPATFDAMTHYIFSFHDSTFECVAESMEAAIEQVGLDEEHLRTLEYFRSARTAESHHPHLRLVSDELPKERRLGKLTGGHHRASRSMIRSIHDAGTKDTTSSTAPRGASGLG